MRRLADSVQQTFRAFHAECAQWEDAVEQLFDDMNQVVAESTRVVESLPPPSSTEMAENVAWLRCVVEQQTDVLTALVNALTGPTAASSKKPIQHDVTSPTVGEPSLDPFERLPRAVAAAASGN